MPPSTNFIPSRTYIAIDLKSFYASVECVERHLDPFQTNLVVADPTRSKSTICLAITPAMKKLGVKNRCRIHEIPTDIEYITAMPRMQLYIDYSVWIHSIYLRWISPDDIHVYSIDECFIDITDYDKLYHLSPRQMAQMLMDAVMKETGICATAGIGTNLYLSKISMDIIAKHANDHIGYLDEMRFRKLLWAHMPLTDFWGIGSGTVRRLQKSGMLTMGDIARTSLTSENLLFKQFGVNAELLIDHAWGIEPCTIKDIKSYVPKTTSLSSGQVLMRNYTFDEARYVVMEMTEQLSLDLVDKEVTADCVSISISYDHKFNQPSTGKSEKLFQPTNSTDTLTKAVLNLYDLTTNRFTGIRRISISFDHLMPATFEQLSLFTDIVAQEKEKSIQQALLHIRKRYGNNAVMKGYNLLECSNLMERNAQIGGHRA